MATETPSPGTPYDGRLFELYTRYVSEPESKMDVYGYTFLVAGYLLAVGGMFVYLVGPTGSNVPESTLFLVRKIAVLFAAPGLLFSLLGIVSILPVTRRSLYAAIGGTVVGLFAVGLFGWYYPLNWHQGTPSYSGLIIAIYTAGVAVVAGVVIMVPVVTGERSYFSETTEGHEYEHPEITIGETDRGGLFAIFKRGTEWSWRFIDQSAVAGSTTSFLSRLEAEERVNTVKEQVARAGLLEIKHAAFRLYETAGGNWQWHLLREDGSAVAEGGRDFESRETADASINAIKDHGPAADVIVREEPAFDLQQRNAEWIWRLVDEDRTPLAEGVTTHSDRPGAKASLETFRDQARDATDLVVESYGVELRSAGDSWQWLLRDNTHRHIASSTREYETKGQTEDSVYDLLERLQDAPIVVDGDPAYDIYRTGSELAWRLVDATGSVVARGHERDDDPDAVAAAAREMKSHAGAADVVEIEDLEFETYRSGDGWHWRLVNTDREVHAMSTETYESQAEASAVVDRVRTEAPEADLIEFETAAFQVYEAEDGAWRWRLIDEDGNVMADSGQGEYDSKDDAMSAMMTLQKNAPDAEHLEIENAAFELFQDDSGWGWRLVDDLGDTIADSATRHETEEGARQAMDSLVNSVSEVEEQQVRHGLFQVYADSDDEWWWRFIRPDGRIIADAPESFGTRHEVEDAIEDLTTFATDATVAVIDRLAVALDPDDWHWELIDEDRDVIAASQLTHESRQAVTDAITDLQQSVHETTVYEIRGTAFDCYRTDDGWTWRLIDGDHEPIAHAATTYDDLTAVESAIERVSKLAPDVDVVDYDDLAFEFHQAEDGWRWRLVDDHDQELAESLTTFSTRAEAQDDLSIIKELGPEAWVSTAE